MNIVAVIPAKPLAQGKERIAAVLDPAFAGRSAVRVKAAIGSVYRRAHSCQRR
jgi:hypothetical protein